MKKIMILVVLIVSTINVYSQSNNDYNSSADIMIDGSRKIGLDCSYTIGNYCEKSIKLASDNPERTDSFSYGKIYIDNEDTLRMSIEKNSISLNDILFLFKDNKYSVLFDFHLSPDILDTLNLDENFTINKGNYNVKENENKSEIIITFDKVNYKQNALPEESIEEESNNNFNNK
ncbi:MAG TPA: hypothetical protein ENI82_00760 [Bacteroidetes bacterium]|nr:hypothetical protein [Bacteroidota bacterium]